MTKSRPPTADEARAATFALDGANHCMTVVRDDDAGVVTKDPGRIVAPDEAAPPVLVGVPEYVVATFAAKAAAACWEARERVASLEAARGEGTPGLDDELGEARADLAARLACERVDFSVSERLDLPGDACAIPNGRVVRVLGDQAVRIRYGCGLETLVEGVGTSDLSAGARFESDAVFYVQPRPTGSDPLDGKQPAVSTRCVSAAAMTRFVRDFWADKDAGTCARLSLPRCFDSPLTDADVDNHLTPDGSLEFVLAIPLGNLEYPDGLHAAIAAALPETIGVAGYVASVVGCVPAKPDDRGDQGKLRVRVRIAREDFRRSGSVA